MLTAEAGKTKMKGRPMPYVDVDPDFPGIVGLLHFRPETGRPLSELAEVLLRGPHTLTRGERELIAAYVSSLNKCHFCASSHGAFAAAQLSDGMSLVEQVEADPGQAPISSKLRELLKIAAKVQRSGGEVAEGDIASARAVGASDIEIHDTVLIAAAFCMFNRYVDGLATIAPDDPAVYAQQAKQIVANGYMSALAS